MHRFKYSRESWLAAHFAAFLPDLGAFGCDAMVPVPLWPRKERKRGYNQALLLAEALSVRLDIPVIDILRRTKTDVIRYAVGQAGICDLSEAVMVGDRYHDIAAAKELGIDSIGVLFGYGSRSELEGSGADYIAETAEEIGSIILA